VKHVNCLFSAIFASALVLGGSIGARAQGEITLLAMSPMRRPAAQVIAKFEVKTGYKVNVTYGALETRKLVAQGRPMDVSLMIPPYPAAIASGSIVVSSATPIATVLTALVVRKGAPKPDISTPAAVRKALLEAKFIGYEDADFGVSGLGPWDALTRLGIADQVATKSYVQLGPGAQDAAPTAPGIVDLTKRLQDGDIDIELNMLSSLLRNKDQYEIVGVLPREICTPAPIVGFVSTHATDPVGAKALLEYLASSEAQAIWKEAGFGPPEN
jgi:molybdate transport system substrate-binding protein